MLDVGRIASRSDACVKYRSIDQKIVMTMREAYVCRMILLPKSWRSSVPTCR